MLDLVENMFSHDAAQLLLIDKMTMGCKGLYITLTCYHDVSYFLITDPGYTLEPPL